VQPITILPEAVTNTRTEPPEALATVHRFFAAWASGDIATMASLVDPQAVIEPVPGLLYSRAIYHGHDGVVAALDEIAGRWERFEMRVEQAAVDGHAVLALIEVAYEKHGMSCEVEIPVVCTLRNGLIFSVVDDGEVR